MWVRFDSPTRAHREVQIVGDGLAGVAGLDPAVLPRRVAYSTLSDPVWQLQMRPRPKDVHLAFKKAIRSQELRKQDVPDEARAILRRAQAAEAGQVDQRALMSLAIRRLREQLETGTSPGEDGLGLAGLLVEAGRVEEGLAAYEAVEPVPDLSVRRAIGMAYCLLRLQRPDDAWRVLPKPVQKADRGTLFLCTRLAGLVEGAVESECGP